MNNYVIFTDSACDIEPSLLKKWGVEFMELTFRFEGEDKEYSNSDMNIVEFYNRMRAGGIAKTAAVNPETFTAAFEPTLKQGTDILYLGFSGGLSTTTNSAKIAAEELRAEYPERKVVVVDTLCASAGQGLLVYLTLEKKKNGASIEEAAAYAQELKPNIAHWFTVDDLVYLKRGGRVSPTVALVGKVLGIKPVMHVDDEGKLINMEKARGRKAALAALADKYTEFAKTPSSGTVFISHGDCADEAQEVANLIKAKHKVAVELITHVGTVIGAHAGPGTIALFFVANKR